MMRLSIALFVVAWVRSSAAQQCPAISASTIVTDNGATQTINAGTTATISPSATVLLESCAQASATYSATVTVDRATLTGTGYTLNSGGVGLPQRGTAVATNTAYLGPLSVWRVEVPPQATAIASQVADVIFGVDRGGSLQVLDGRPRLTRCSGFADLTGTMAYLTMTAGSGSANISASSFGSATLASGASVYATGATFTMSVLNGGTGTVTGFRNLARVERGGTLIAAGTSGRNYAFSGGLASVTDGLSCTLSVYSGGSGSVGGSNTLVAYSGGNGAVGNGATVTVLSGATVSVYTGAATAAIRSGGIVTAFAGATVTSVAGATLTVTDPVQTSLVSIGEAAVFGEPEPGTIFAARTVAQPSGLRKREQKAMTYCSANQQACPNLTNELICTDTKRDLYNCGGCALTGHGKDCTADGEGDVECVEGSCVVSEWPVNL